MDLKDPKDLKRLADACRKAGISEFKGFGVEFTLAATTYAPPKAKRLAKGTQMPLAGPQDTIETDEPTPNDLLYWSVGAEEPSQ